MFTPEEINTLSPVVTMLSDSNELERAESAPRRAG
jgi:hypothetical protein